MPLIDLHQLKRRKMENLEQDQTEINHIFLTGNMTAILEIDDR